MPGALSARNKLNNLTVTAYQKVRRNLYTLQPGVIGMRAGIQLVGKELRDTRPAKLIRGQADIVYDQQFNFCRWWTLIIIG